MGTRAMILFEGKPVAATHWDGYPESLGADLVKAKPKSPSDILKVAKGHTIDAADRKYSAKEVDEERIRAIVASAKASGKKISPAKVRAAFKEGAGFGGAVMTPENYPVSDISYYDDFAEFEYNVTADGKVTVRPLSGTWRESRHSKTPFKVVNLKKLKEVS